MGFVVYNFALHHLLNIITMLYFREMWKFLQLTVADLQRLNGYVKDNREIVKQLLKEAPNITAYVTFFVNMRTYVSL